MTEWWTSLDLFMKILWCIAIASSLIFIIETVLTFIGADVEMDMDTDFDMPDGGFEGDPSMNLYTFRNLVNFLLGMSWTAILLNGQIASKALLMAIAFAVGAILVFAVMMLVSCMSIFVTASERYISPFRAKEKAQERYRSISIIP